MSLAVANTPTDETPSPTLMSSSNLSLSPNSETESISSETVSDDTRDTNKNSDTLSTVSNSSLSESENTNTKEKETEFKYNADINTGPPLPTSAWDDSQSPLMMCMNPKSASKIHTNHDDNVMIPMNKVFDVNSDLFKGSAVVRTVGLPSSEEWYFSPSPTNKCDNSTFQPRRMGVTLSGRFKKRIRFDKVFTGQTFEKPFTKIPASFIVSAALKLIKAMAPSLKCNSLESKTPYFVYPLCCAAEIVNIQRPTTTTKAQRQTQKLDVENSKENKCDEVEEEEEEMMSLDCIDREELREDISVLGEKFAGMSAKDRKLFFADEKELKNYYFETDFIYSFATFSPLLSFKTYALHLLGMEFPIQPYLACPISIQFFAVDAEENENETETEEEKESENDMEKAIAKNDGLNCEYFLNAQVWHTKLVCQMYHGKNGNEEKCEHCTPQDYYQWFSGWK